MSTVKSGSEWNPTWRDSIEQNQNRSEEGAFSIPVRIPFAFSELQTKWIPSIPFCQKTKKKKSTLCYSIGGIFYQPHFVYACNKAGKLCSLQITPLFHGSVRLVGTIWEKYKQARTILPDPSVYVRIPLTHRVRTTVKRPTRSSAVTATQKERSRIQRYIKRRSAFSQRIGFGQCLVLSHVKQSSAVN